VILAKIRFAYLQSVRRPWALAIFQNLTQHSNDVFFDVLREPSALERYDAFLQ
jgi:hypothetical protein